MRPKALVLLALVVALLGGFIFFYEAKRPPAEERARRAKRVLATQASAVRALRIEHGGEVVRLERVGRAEDSERAAEESRWRLLEPVADRADGWQVQTLLDALTSLERQRDLPDVDPATLGLDRPRAVVALATEEGETVLEIGADLPAGATMAVAIRGKKGGVVVANSLFAELTRGVDAWRSREALSAERDRIVRLTLAPRGGEPIVLSRAKPGDPFRLEAPSADRADREKVDALVADLAALRVKDFLNSPGSLEREKLAAGPGAIEIGLQSEAADGAAVADSAERLEIGEPLGTDGASSAGQGQAEARVLRAGGRTFTADTRLGDTLRLEAAQWRSAAWSAAEVYRIEGVEVRGLGEPVDLRRVNGTWKRGGQEIDGAVVSDLLHAVAGTRAQAILDRAQAEARGAVLGEPRVTVRLMLDQGAEENLRAYAPLATGLIPAMASDREAVLLLPPGALREIESKLAPARKAKEKIAG